eukprot:comp44733_c0_seq1/m.47514 comp44733_c0_seq1/g.47514  ORF comp44733_c0_seq1/g.47514 comp44733_c0_seq1/m.47514 type:complete len:119 (-) comp44733_c0_seq1:42-398(-)
MAVEPAEPRLKIHTFSDTHAGMPVHFQVVQMDQSLIIWGGSEPKMSNLTLSLPVEKGPFPATVLLGTVLDSTALAERLARKLKKQVFVSHNFPPNLPNLDAFVEQRLVQEMREHPEAF